MKITSQNVNQNEEAEGYVPGERTIKTPDKQSSGVEIGSLPENISE